MRKSSVIAALFGLLATTPAFAGGGGASIVFDPTNWFQTSVSASESLRATADRAVQMQTQLMQYSAQLKQLVGMPQGALQSLIEKNAGELKDMAGFISNVNKTYGDVSTVHNNITRRFDEAKISGQSWPDYVKTEADRINRGVGNAADRASADRSLLDRVNKDYEQVREWQSLIPQNEGMKDSMMLMNSQMNKLVTQNAEVMKSMATASLQQQNARIDDLAQKQKEIDQAEALRNAAINGLADDRAAINKLRVQRSLP
jgi:P-type conjugative transfer protein TrbJ